MVKAAKTVDSGGLYEVRRDLDCGVKTLRRGSRISLAELERLLPGKAGPLRRTGLIRPVGETDHERHSVKRDEWQQRRQAANRAGVASMRGTDEQEQV